MDFKEFLVSQGPQILAEKNARHARKYEWLASVELLINRIAHWLNEDDPHKLLDIRQFEVNIQEYSVGHYSVLGLEIRLSEKCVRVLPVALEVLGPRVIASEGGRWAGRVDLAGDNVRFEIYRHLTESNEESWHIRDTDSYTFLPLDKGSLGNAMVKAFS